MRALINACERRVRELAYQLIVGALKAKEIHRLRIVDGKITEQEIIHKDLGRVRDVATGPDGNLYVILDGPHPIVRLVPAE
jgi:glucose/arabinose dehydrogenase